jgi:hypothetical protein
LIINIALIAVNNLFINIIGTLFPNFISVNNAIYLCTRCSNIHRGFGEFSTIKSPTFDDWTELEIKIVCQGGNQRLKHFLYDYSIPQLADPNYKYFIYALDYYRRLLKYDAENGEKKNIKKPVKPDTLLGLESLRPSQTVKQDNNNYQYQNLQNQNRVPIQSSQNKTNNTKNDIVHNSGNSQVQGQNQAHAQNSFVRYENPQNQRQNNTSQRFPQQQRKEKSFFDEIGDFFVDYGNELNKAFTTVGKDLEEAKIKENTETFFKEAYEDTKKVIYFIF